MAVSNACLLDPCGYHVHSATWMERDERKCYHTDRARARPGLEPGPGQGYSKSGSGKWGVGGGEWGVGSGGWGVGSGE